MEQSSQTNQADNVFDELSNPMIFQSMEYEIPTFDRIKPEEDDDYFVINDYEFPATPNGSFWDDDGKYYNRYQCDIYGGRLDKYGNYHIPKNKEKQKQENEAECFGPKKENDEDYEMINDLKTIAKEKEKMVKNYQFPEEDKSDDDEGNGQVDANEKSEDCSCCSYDEAEVSKIYAEVKRENMDVYENSQTMPQTNTKIVNAPINDENKMVNIKTIQ